MPPGTQPTFEDLFESAPDGLVVIDRAGLIALVNRGVELMFGRGRGELTLQRGFR